MKLRLSQWATCLAIATVVGLSACNSNSGSTPPGGGSGGQAQAGAGGKAGQAGQTAGTGGNPTGGTGGQGGAGGQTSTGGHPGGAGGKSDAGGVGGKSETGGTQAKPDAAAGGEGGAGQGGSSPPEPADAAAGAGGNLDGGSPSKDATAPDAQVVSNPRRVLLCDEGNQRVMLVDLDNPGSGVWTRAVEGLRDAQLVGGDRIAVSTAKGYVEIDIKTGEIKKQVSKFTGVESLRRLPNGNTVLGANAEGGVTLQELDSQDAAVPGHKVTFTNYTEFRMLRRTPQGTFLIGVGNKLAEVNWDKKTIWEMTIPDGNYVYQGLRLADKTIAVTSGYGAAIVIINPTTKDVRIIGGKSQPDATTIVPNFYAGYQILPNGHFVVTNWEGHGPGHGGTGVQLLEYDSSGRLVWKWKQDSKLVSSLHHVIVLDGLDTSKLHDDVNGVLAPVAQ